MFSVKSKKLLLIVTLSNLIFGLALPEVGFAGADYETLANKLKQNNFPDSKTIRSLPEPETARQHWLFGRVVGDFEESLSHLKQAVSGAQQHKPKYMKTLIRQFLLGTRREKKFFRQQINELLEQDKPVDSEFWLLAGRLARLWELNQLATRCFQKALKSGADTAPVLLDLGQLALKENSLERADEFLERYFLSGDTTRRPRYWLLRGRLFEAKGADSEAYMAYSHIINNYPRSLLLNRAEKEISQLSLPETLYASKDSDEKSAQESDQEVKTGSSKEYYRVQVGSFRRRERARSLRRRLKKEFSEKVIVNQARVKGKLYYRVQVGAKKSLNPARKLLSKLRRSGHQGYVVKN